MQIIHGMARRCKVILQPRLEFHFVGHHRTGEECPKRVCCSRLQNQMIPSQPRLLYEPASFIVSFFWWIAAKRGKAKQPRILQLLPDLQHAPPQPPYSWQGLACHLRGFVKIIVNSSLMFSGPWGARWHSHADLLHYYHHYIVYITLYCYILLH